MGVRVMTFAMLVSKRTFLTAIAAPPAKKKRALQKFKLDIYADMARPD